MSEEVGVRVHVDAGVLWRSMRSDVNSEIAGAGCGRGEGRVVRCQDILAFVGSETARLLIQQVARATLFGFGLGMAV